MQTKVATRSRRLWRSIKTPCYNYSVMEKLIAGARNLGLQLSPEQLEQFEIYYQQLVNWNKRVNLTAITDYEEVQVNHFLDSLTVLLAWQPQQDTTETRVIDVGTGGGVPGLPLKIVFPSIRLGLLEATKKKIAFLYHLRERLGLEGIEIVAGRAEDIARIAPYREGFDLVLSRAVAPMPALVELTLPFCAIGGLTVFYKKGDITEETEQASRAIGTMGGKIRDLKAVTLPEFTDRRCLVVVDKISATPEQYPRRPGIPAKRPLI